MTSAEGSAGRVAAIEELARAGKFWDLLGVLDGLDDAGRRELRQWWRSDGRRLARPDGFDVVSDWMRRACVLALVVELETTPKEVSSRAAWTRWWVVWDEQAFMPELVTRLVARGRDWCAEFVEVVGAVRAGAESWAPAEIASLAMGLISHFDLPVPEGDVYARGWVQMIADSQRLVEQYGQGVPYRTPIEVSEQGQGRYALGDRSPAQGLAAWFAVTPRLQETLVCALRVPGAMAGLGPNDRPGWSLRGTVVDAVAAGRLDPAVLFPVVIESLAGARTTLGLPAKLELLDALELRRADVMEQLDLLLNTFPVLHGRVTAVLLPVLLDGELSRDTLADLGNTVLSRPEKAQKRVLLASLTSTHRANPATPELLAVIAASDDTALAAKGRTALAEVCAAQGQLVTPGEPEADPVVDDVAWTPTLPRRPAQPFEPLEPTAADIEPWILEGRVDSRITGEAALLDAANRLRSQDPDTLRRSLVRLPEPQESGSRVHWRLREWAETGEPRLTMRDEVVLDRRPFDRLTDRLALEALSAPPGGELLSTPSTAEGTLSWADLVSRLRAAQSDVGVFDLVQALLRLDCDGVDVTDAPDVPQDPVGGPLAAGTVALEVAARWVRLGGAGDRQGVLVYEGTKNEQVVVRASQFPDAWPEQWQEGAAIRAALGQLCGDSNGLYTAPLAPFRFLGVAPWAAEVLAARYSRDDDSSVMAAVCAAPTAFGLGAYHALARALGAQDGRERVAAAEDVLAFIRRGGFDPDALSRRALALVRTGQTPMARAATGWEQVILGGGLRQIWPTITTVMDRAAGTSPRPVGLADLLRIARRYVGVVATHAPEHAVPPAVRALADAKGSTKAHHEARAFCAAAAPRAG